MINKKRNIIWISVVFSVIILTIATALISNRYKSKGSEDKALAAVSAKLYVCSMHPQVLQDHPGDCPICGMFLIEKIGDDKNRIDTTLNDVVRHVNESVLASVATVTPEFYSAPVIVEASGIVTCDPRKIRVISARFRGVIEKSFIKYTFQPVKNGQKIFQIYCPEIYVDKWNYVKLIQTYPDQENLTVEALQWFRLLGLTRGQIDSLKHAVKPDYHLYVYSDAEGYAVGPDFDPDNYFTTPRVDENDPGTGSVASQNIGLNEGVTIEKGTPLFKIIDLKSLRIDLKIRTDDIRLLKPGQKVVVIDPASPHNEFNGTVSQIEPLNGGLFQVVKVYVKDNHGQLLPGKQIHSHISAGSYDAFWVPETSIVELGQRQTVFLYENGKFVAVPVKTGMKYNGRVEIISGIDNSSEIALNGLLLTDSDGFIRSK
jgi:Cu(I)/Ag(I) efflux system membrane fusion protein